MFKKIFILMMSCIMLFGIPVQAMTSNELEEKQEEIISQHFQGASANTDYMVTRISNKETDGKINIKKKMPKSVYDSLTAAEMPKFRFRLKSTDERETPYEEIKEIDFKDLNKSDPNQYNTAAAYVTMTVTFENIPGGTYDLEELDNADFFLDNISEITDDEVLQVKEREGKKYIEVTLNKNTGEEGVSATFTNNPKYGQVQIMKLKEDRRSPLKGVTFTLSSDTDPNFQNIKKTTGNDGKITFDKLPEGTYTLIETETANGYVMLKDPIKIKIPITYTNEEVTRMRLDTSKAFVIHRGKYIISDGYQFPVTGFKITNHVTPDMPMTGIPFSWKIFIPAVIAFACILAVLRNEAEKESKKIAVKAEEKGANKE